MWLTQFTTKYEYFPNNHICGKKLVGWKGDERQDASLWKLITSQLNDVNEEVNRVE